jgi:hypothetical protein
MGQEISIPQAYEWVKTGHWNLTQFKAWCDAFGGAVHKSEPVDPAKMDAIGKKIGEVKQ